MKATVLAESSYFINFHQALSSSTMPTDMSQVGVVPFPFFKNILVILFYLCYSLIYVNGKATTLLNAIQNKYLQ